MLRHFLPYTTQVLVVKMLRNFKTKSNSSLTTVLIQRATIDPAIPRLEKLKLEIEKQIGRAVKSENVELVERIYMYYDRYN
jgi:hypothetical protein